MAEEIPQDPQQQQNYQLVIDERDLRTIYSNSYRIHATADEVVVDLKLQHARSESATGPAAAVDFEDQRSCGAELPECQAAGLVAGPIW